MGVEMGGGGSHSLRNVAVLGLSWGTNNVKALEWRRQLKAAIQIQLLYYLLYLGLQLADLF